MPSTRFTTPLPKTPLLKKPGASSCALRTVHKLSLTSVFQYPSCDIVLELYGTEGTAWVYNDEGWKIKTYFDGEQQLIPSQYEDLYQYQFEHFAGMCT